MAETLPKRLGTGLLTAYGVGIMVGAGIYVLVGHAAGAAGIWAPLAFLLAGVVAVPSALSFAELSARIPEAAGDSAYVEHGLRAHWLAVLVGLINIVAGVIGGAAVLRGGVGYLTALVPVGPTAIIPRNGSNGNSMSSPRSATPRSVSNSITSLSFHVNSRGRPPFPCLNVFVP